MAPKAHHLNKVPLNWYKTVERLFSAAFRQSATAYKRASLCGWRPLSPGAHIDPLLSGSDESEPWIKDDHSGVVIQETDVGISIEIEVPALKEGSLYLEVAGDTLIVRGECIEAEACDTDQMSSLIADNEQSIFERLIQLPIEAHPGQVQARLVGKMIRVIIAKQ